MSFLYGAFHMTEFAIEACINRYHGAAVYVALEL